MASTVAVFVAWPPIKAATGPPGTSCANRNTTTERRTAGGRAAPLAAGRRAQQRVRRRLAGDLAPVAESAGLVAQCRARSVRARPFQASALEVLSPIRGAA